MPGIEIKPKVKAEIQRQLNLELAASHGYLALALWCEDQHLCGFARYFYKQADEERTHAKRFMDHLLDRDVLPELTAVPAPKIGFDALLEIAKTAQQMEQGNTQGIHKAYEAAVEAKDYAAQVLLQEFISEQVEEEAWTDEMVVRVQRASCAGGVAELDRHIERYLAGDKE